MLLDEALRDVQSSFPWRELATWLDQADFSLVEGLSSRGFKRYSLPANFLSLLRAEGFSYHLEGRYLCTDSDEFDVQVAILSTDPNHWSTGLYKSVYTELAVRLARGLANNQGLAQEMERLASRALSEAKAKQSNENGPRLYRGRARGNWLSSYREG
jgi:hypothetical protein